MVSIYALIDPQNRACRYVGKTKNRIEQRLKAHISDARRHPNIARFRWVNKLKREGRSPEIMLLEEVDAAVWQESEQFWIAYFRALGADLLNATDGGDGIHGHVHSEETKRKMGESARRAMEQNPDLIRQRTVASKAARNDPEVIRRTLAIAKASHNTPEYIAACKIRSKAMMACPERREKFGGSNRGKKLSDETKRLIGERSRGRRPSEEVRQKMRAARLGYVHSESSRLKTSAAHRARNEAIRNCPWTNSWPSLVLTPVRKHNGKMVPRMAGGNGSQHVKFVEPC